MISIAACAVTYDLAIDLSTSCLSMLKLFENEDNCKLKTEWLDGAERAGITSGASAPEELVKDLCEKILHLT